MGLKIMLLRFSSMGDLAILEPVLRNFLEQYPEHELILVSRPKFAPIFAPLDRLQYHAVDLDQDFKGPLGLWRLSTQLHQLGADYIIDLHQVLRTIILRRYFQWRWGLRIPSLDKGRMEKSALSVNRADKERKPLRATYLRYADLFEEIGLPVDLEPPLAAVPKRKLNAELAPLLNKDGLRIGIAPFGRYPAKSYPPDLVEALIEQLLDYNPQIQIYLFGGGEEQLLFFEKQAKRWPKAVYSLAGKYSSLDQELALMAELNLMIAVDSANMHFAAMLEIPILSLWGPTHPFYGFYPWLQPMDHAILADLRQYPTLPSSMNGKNTHPGTEDCMRSITVEMIVTKVAGILTS